MPSELARAKAWVNKKSPTSTLASLSLRALTVSRWRRSLASSSTSSWTSVAVWIISTTAASVICSLSARPTALAAAAAAPGGAACPPSERRA